MALPRSVVGPRPGFACPQQGVASPSSGVDGMTYTPKSPGTRCPTCASQGKEVWVIPGRCCGYCGTPCD
ncbi:hypothetical protein N3K66_000780 [Trichothecium roseum]|uniref:Uncharacterized protein n=1 Tax=Trichothecium roseum TaxID=47278 RepID=A0ACC0VEE2_9HYPO|nr:hypothetical protein N3K66_000780 [Trichothecium roseum]